MNSKKIIVVSFLMVTTFGMFAASRGNARPIEANKTSSFKLTKDLRKDSEKSNSYKQIATPLVSDHVQQFFISMGTNFQAVVDALSKMTLGQIQRLVEYLKGAKATASPEEKPVIQEVVNEITSSKSGLEDTANSLAKLPSRVARKVLNTVVQKPEMQVSQSIAGQSVESVSSELDMLSIRKDKPSGNLTLPVERYEAVQAPQELYQVDQPVSYVASDPIRYTNKQLAKQKLEKSDAPIMNVMHTASVEPIKAEFIDVQKQQSNVIESDFNEKILLSDQLQEAQKQKKQMLVFQKNQKKQKVTPEHKKITTQNALDALSTRIKLLQDKIAEKKQIAKKSDSLDLQQNLYQNQMNANQIKSEINPKYWSAPNLEKTESKGSITPIALKEFGKKNVFKYQPSKQSRDSLTNASSSVEGVEQGRLTQNRYKSASSFLNKSSSSSRLSAPKDQITSDLEYQYPLKESQSYQGTWQTASL